MPVAVEAVSEIWLKPRPAGLRAVFLVETRSRADRREVEELFRELTAHVEVRQLSQGRLMSYIVQAGEAGLRILDTIEDVLRESFEFVAVHRSFEPGVLRMVRDLCRDTKSKLIPIPRCNICGKPEPFPRTVVSLRDGAKKPLTDRTYCARCSAEAEASSNKGFIKVLLGADERDFGGLERAEMQRRRSGREEISFRIR